MSDPNSPRAEWPDQSRENENENENGDEMSSVCDSEDPFGELAGFIQNSDDENNNHLAPALFKARPQVPSEASDVDAAKKNRRTPSYNVF